MSLGGLQTAMPHRVVGTTGVSPAIKQGATTTKLGSPKTKVEDKTSFSL